MITTVRVKYGHPILCLPYRALRVTACLVVIFNVIIIIYLFEMFNLAIDIKQRVGDYIDLILENGHVLPIIVAGAGIINLPLNIVILFVIYQSFNSTKKCYSVLLLLVFLVSLLILVADFVLIIMAFSHGHIKNPVYLKYLYIAMNNYSEDGLTKSKIDRLQVEFQCCGARNYSDWYYIDWFDKNFIRATDMAVKGEAPYSCCSIRSIYPCIHHGIESGAGAYTYTSDANFSLSVMGCYDMIEAKKRSTSWNVIGYIICLIVMQFTATLPLRLVQTAHVERGMFDKESHVYTSWLIGCYAGKLRTSVDPPPVPPLPPDLMD